MELFIKNDTIENKLKLIKTFKLNNIHLYDRNNNIKKYKSAEDILMEWYHIRLEYYVKRKQYIIISIKKELEYLKYKKLFVEYVLKNKIIINNQKKSEIISKLENLKFPKLEDINNKLNYDYITNIPLFSLTLEKIEELNNKLKLKKKN